MSSDALPANLSRRIWLLAAMHAGMLLIAAGAAVLAFHTNRTMMTQTRWSSFILAFAQLCLLVCYAGLSPDSWYRRTILLLLGFAYNFAIRFGAQATIMRVANPQELGAILMEQMPDLIQSLAPAAAAATLLSAARPWIGHVDDPRHPAPRRRLTIGGLMIGTAMVAIVLVLLRLDRRSLLESPPALLPLRTLRYTALAAGSALAMLSCDRRRAISGVAVYWLGVAAHQAGMALWVTSRPSWLDQVNWELQYAMWMFGTLALVRYAGYRLVVPDR